MIMMMLLLSSSSRALLLSQLLFFQLCRQSSQFSVTLETKTRSSTTSSASTTSVVDNNTAKQQQQQQLSGSWSAAKQALRNPNCCVVSISGLNHHLSTLQSYFCGEDAPSDIDLRMRIRCSGNGTDSMEVLHEDCKHVYDAIMDPPRPTSTTTTSWRNTNNIIDIEQQNKNFTANNNPCIQALQELALGIHSLANNEQPQQQPLLLLQQSTTSITDVHMRIVCASSYNANDPPFHTDKCPLRGYVTLCGPGTEYMKDTCAPWEYVALRTLGVEGLEQVNRNKVEKSLRMAKELEFIVMKGDYYDDTPPEVDVGVGDSTNNKNKKKLWSRSEACVHRSPPGNNAKRVILSLDLADGGDDQEWEERGRKRSWRVGMTQRKSHLVS